MKTNFFLLPRRWRRAASLAAVATLVAACAGNATSGGSDDTTASDALADTPGDGTAADTATPDTAGAATLVIDSPQANAIISASGSFALQAHVLHPPTTGGPFAIQVADAVSGASVATATADDLTKPVAVDVNVGGLPGGSYAVRVSVHDAKAVLVASAELVFTVNVPPTAPVVAIAPAQPTAADTLAATLTKPATDPEGDAVTYKYAWSRNGVVTAQTGSSVVAGQTKKGEVWVVTVTPADPYGQGWPGVAQVLVGNQAPVPATLAADATIVDLLGDVSASTAKAASDPDGDPLALAWKWQVNGQPVPGKNTPKTTVPALGTALGAPLKVGDTITLVQAATDGLATTTSQALSWTVADVAPHLFLDAPAQNSTQSAAGAFDLKGHVENPPTSGGPFQLEVADSVSGFVVSQSALDTLNAPFAAAVNVAGIPAGTYAVTVTLRNAAKAFVASADLQFTVNAPPSQPVVLILPATPTAADSFTAGLQTPAVDPEGDAISYTYAWTRNGETTGQTAATVPAGVAKKNEVWVVSVTPADAYGKGWPGGAYVVIANQPPVAATLAAAATQLDLEGEASASTAVAASDPDGDALLLTWQWSLNGAVLPGLNAPHVLAADLVAAAGKPLAVGDAVTLVQVALDGQAQTTSAPLAWTVADFLPHLLLDSPGQNAVLTSAGPFTLQAHVENPPTAGGPFALVVTDAVSGALVTQASFPDVQGPLTLQVDIGGVPDGTYDLRVTLRNTGGAALAQRDLLFSTNTPPSAPQVAITPQLPTAADTLVVNLLTPATDTEADTIAYSYQWLRNGALTALTGASVPPGVAKKAEIWTAVVTAHDSYGAGWPATADVVIGNLAPLPAVVTADTQVVGLLGEVSAATAQAATDPDGDALTVTWHWAVNGAPVPGKTSAATTVLSLRTALGATIHAGDVITVAATADDGQAVALSNQLTWTVQAGDDVCAARPNCGIDATCANNGSLDPICTCKPTTIGNGQYCVLVTGLSPSASTFVLSDGTVNFTVGGDANVPGTVVVDVVDPASGVTLTSTTIPSLGGASAIKAVSPATPTGTVTVRIRHNGVPLGERTYAIARNHKPTAPQGGLTPANPDVTKAVSYAQTVTSTDADAGQTVTLKYAWSVNGVVNTALTASSVPAGTAKKGNTLTLKVTPNDGLENGAALTLNGVIANAPPSTFAGTYSTTTPTATSTVVANLTSPPTVDPDGEAVTYSYQWFVNGTAVTGATVASLDLTTVAIPGHTLATGDALRVDVTASDGTATTKVALATLTLQ